MCSNPWSFCHNLRQAMELTGSEFSEAVHYVAQAWLPARTIVKAALEGRHAVDASGAIIK